ncbi:MAG: hypothetical protein A2X90_03970 [Deltaproteobacteria bacterium GWA2_65_63]|nr:MAG: hypothetical protein A2X90_03970 [Deltaproteobacteria bacterium GWA2_65_63]
MHWIRWQACLLWRLTTAGKEEYMPAEVPFFDKLGMLRDALDKYNGAPSAIGDAGLHLSDPDVRREFFRTLERADWITPLREAGYFDNPPKPIATPSAGVQHPIWPESMYLARMAPHAPAEVASIFADIEIDNVSVIGDMLDAAMAMPANVAATLVPAISRVAQEGTLWLHFKDASDLCVRLVGGDEVPAAMTLAETLFAPKFEDGQEEPSRRDEYWYKDGLKKVVPALVGREPREFLMKLCEWLKVSVDAKKHVDLDSGSDYSYLWRPAIEEHEQNRDYDFAGAMVGFVRQGLEQAIQDGKLLLEEALEIIARYSSLVFRRIRIHLINEFAEQNPELARRIMMDRDLFDDHGYKHEYAMLVGRRLNLLTDEERDRWFGWVDAGPDMSDVNESIRERLGREATDEERRNRKQYWQFEKLHCVRKYLEGQRRKIYDEMLVKHGEPELADLNTHISSRWGHDSPMNVEDLTKLTFTQAVEKVSFWVPGERRFVEPDIEGLASTFEQYVATNPEAFSVKACALIGCPAIYVRGFLHQMAEAVKSSCEINVSAVVELCQWVLEQPMRERTTPTQGDEGLVDKDWQWTRDEISQFVKNLCEAKSNDAPKYPLEGLRERIWQAVGALCRDRVNSYIVHDVSEDDPRAHDYLTLGINSPRGKAVEAALEYARWIANHIKRVDGKHEVIPGGFEAIPEVREMLEWQIAPDNRSFEALAVIGSRIGLIYWIDRSWLAANAGRLFRLAGIEDSPPITHGWAAWNAFLVWVGPHIEFYRLFKEQFAYAVAQSVQVNLIGQSHEQPMNHLGEHLMILYGRGQLGLDDDEGLIKRFLTDSNPDIRRHAIGFVGRSLGGDEKIPEKVVGQFKTLWDAYWAGAGKQDAQQKPDAWLFGTWFSSGKFPEQWALEQLENYVNVTITPEPDHSIVEQLARVAQADIVRAVRILDRMVRGDREGWRIHGWLESARKILEMAMKAGGDARTHAAQVINYLGRRGHTGFGDLLKLGGMTDPL